MDHFSIIFLIIICIILSPLFYFGIILYYGSIESGIIKDFLYFRNLLRSTATNTESIEMILHYVQEILRKIHTLIFFQKWGKYLFIKTSKKPIQMLLDGQIQMIVTLLCNYRSDLTLRLTEQQKILESAKSEVEKNIHGTTELNQVSELQKARLDRQIEQFEELQKVLVRV